jgi:CheY-like chemotaxis protein
MINRQRNLLWLEDDIDVKPYLFKLLYELVGKDNLFYATDMENGILLLSSDIMYDCIVMDIMLPESKRHKEIGLINLDGGLRILEKIKSGEFQMVSPEIPIIIMTARTNGTIVEPIKSLLGNHPERLLSKPISPKVVVKLVKEILETI